MRKSLLLILCLGVLSVLLVSCGTGQAYLVSPCSDSDGGKNPDVAGTLKFKSGLTQKSYTDSCTSPKGVISKNGTALVEYYCALRSFATETMKCQYGCEDGACKPAPTFMINVVDQTVCGDGMVQGTEQCDDGNTISGDGCSGTCLNENSTLIINVVDQTVCGDGMVQGTEQCDDGNTISGDGCSGTCLNETP